MLSRPSVRFEEAERRDETSPGGDIFCMNHFSFLLSTTTNMANGNVDNAEAVVGPAEGAVVSSSSSSGATADVLDCGETNEQTSQAGQTNSEFNHGYLRQVVWLPLGMNSPSRIFFSYYILLIVCL